MDCLFCNIAQGKIEANILLQNEHLVVFDDIAPQAPVHKLIIPRKHIATVNDLQPKDNHLIGEMVVCGKQLAKDLDISEAGYRLVLNCNQGGGQAVYHIHLHLLGGRQMQWPPG